MNIYWISSVGIARHQAHDLKPLLLRADGFVWVDIPECNEHTARTLSDVFGFHPLAVQSCRERTHLPKIHAYADHLFVILHAPEPGSAGHIHLLELDQFIGRRYLITIHGPLGEGVLLDHALRETRGVLERIEAGRFRPGIPAELSYTIVTALVRGMESLVAAFASKVAALERQVIRGKIGKPEHALEAMFHLRHELLTIRTIAAHSREAYARITKIAPRFMPPEEQPYMEDLMDQFDRIRSMCDGEQAFLQGVIDFYQTQTVTKLNIAMERLALISALLLPVTAIASIYGMNIIVNQQTQFAHVASVLVGIGIIMILMFRWAKRQGWW